MRELIKRQDAIDAVAKEYRYESERMKALQEVLIVTEEEIQNKVIDAFADRMISMMSGHEEDILKVAEQLKSNPYCFVSNEELYPLCKGNGKEKCHNCCIYEDYEKYHSPYND